MEPLDQITNLIEKLNTIDDCMFLSPNKYGYRYLKDHCCPDIESLCNETLITPDAHPNYEIINIINSKDGRGFHVGPGEVDSFGWLSGIITYPDKIRKIVFG